MPYDTNSGEAPAAESLEAGSVESEAKPTEVHIPSDVLPPGIKEGDMLRCTAMDENGCTFEHEPAAAEEGESWEQDFRKEMSPQTSQSEAM